MWEALGYYHDGSIFQSKNTMKLTNKLCKRLLEEKYISKELYYTNIAK